MKNYSATRAAMIIAAAGIATGFRGVDPWDGPHPPKRHDENQDRDERLFLETLKGEPKAIWRRRIARGLSASELAFIRDRLKEPK
jgi:hypothetical protein